MSYWKSCTACKQRDMSNSLLWSAASRVAGASAETWRALARSSTFLPCNVSMLRYSLYCVIYITDKASLPSVPCVCAFCLNFWLTVWAHSHMCVIRFHIQKLTFDKMSLMKTISWELNQYCHKFWGRHQHTLLTNTLTNCTKPDTLTKILVLLPVDWEKIDLLIRKQ